MGSGFRVSGIDLRVPLKLSRLPLRVSGLRVQGF